MVRLTEERVAEALRETGAIVSETSRKLGVSRTALYKFLQNHNGLLALRLEIEEELMDLAEAHIAKAIYSGDMKTVRWYLERKAKDRGYITRQETTGKDGEPLQIGEIIRTVVVPTKVK